MNFIKKNIKMIVIVIGILSLTGIVAYATGTYVFESTDVRFDNTNTEITAGDVQGALEEVYHHVTDYNDIKDLIENFSNSNGHIKELSNVNLNDIRATGFYGPNATCSNAPSAIPGYLEVLSLDNDYVKQRWTPYNSSNEYVRELINGTWSPWTSINDLIDHNAVFRGKSLGSSVTSAQWTAISSGTFNDLYVGDYWTINGVKWRIAGFDIYYGKGDTAFNTHHAVIVPDTNLTSAKMNNTDTTTGGYVGSKMYTDTLPTVLTTIRNAFGTDHVLKYSNLLTTSINDSLTNRWGNASGASDNWGWKDRYLDLMNENQVYGSIVWSSSGLETGSDNVQFPLFRLKPEFINKQQSWYWLRNVASSAHFAGVDRSGYSYYGSRASESGGVRPYFYIG